ncbi:nucleoside-diphosphate kinase [Candidatus Gracilibacteria bacterium]|nr:nucleoside-diphosphate kinase [Candidatus Gracilibacteria bacterium]
MKERTLILLKPDAINRGLCGEILSRFEKAGIKIVASKMAKPDKDHYFKHYEEIGTMVTRRGQKIFEITVDMMMEGPVIAFVLEGYEVVEVVRKLVGTTEPKAALPGTIRGDYSYIGFKSADELGIGVKNLVHASGNSEEAKKEIALWFNDDELFDY